MKPFLFAAVLPTVLRRFVRVCSFLLPSFLAVAASAEMWTGTSIGAGASGGGGTTAGHQAPWFTFGGSGSDIYGTADSFYFVHIPTSGDVVASTRVIGMTNTNAWAKTGVMVRASLDAGAPNVAMVISPNGIPSFQVRASAGGTTEVVTGSRVSFPSYSCLVKLTRTGNTFTGYVMPYGSTSWTQVGSRTLTLPAQLYSGFAACSHAVGTDITVDLREADVNGAGTAPAAPTNVRATNVGPHDADVVWTDNSDHEDGFRVYVWRDERHATYPELQGTIPPNTTTFHVSNLVSESGYQLMVTAFRSDAEGSAQTGFVTPQDPTQPPATPYLKSAWPSAPNTMDVSWDEIDGWNSGYETGFEVERAPHGGAFARIATLPANTLGYRDTGVTGGNAYDYRVRAVKETLYSSYSNIVTATATSAPDNPPPPPPGWTAVDVGAPALHGSVNGQPPTFTMQAAGADIYGTSDSFGYFAKAASGDVTLIAHVNSLTNTNSWAKAGVMIRSALDPSAPNVAMVLSAAQTCGFQVRASAGGSTDVTLGAWVTPPYWVKLTRVGNVFTGFVSPDGMTWTQVGSRTVALPAEVYVGFAVTSHNVNALTTAAFDHADVTTSTPPPPPPPPTWTQTNLGGATGSFTSGANDSVASITATSGDIYGTSDSGVFVSRSVTGPGTWIIRVNGLTNSDGWAKAGIMLRASLAVDSANAFVALTPSVGAVFQSRAATSGSSTTTHGHTWGPGPGALLKLVRGGGTLSASFSTNNGTTWTPLGSIPDDLPATIYVGYAASSHNPSVATTATFAAP